MPNPCTCGIDGPKIEASIDCQRHGSLRRLSLLAKRATGHGRWAPTDGLDNPYRSALAGGHDRGFPGASSAADPDGFAVFGRFPKGFLDHVLATRWLGNVRRNEVLHVCSGTLSETETWTVDIRPEARPTVVADGRALPFRDGAFPAILLDPPYSEEYARNLYKQGNPRPSWLLKEAARVVAPNGRIGILHVAVPFAPPGCFLVGVWGVTIGVGFRIRALTIYEKEQPALL